MQDEMQDDCAQVNFFSAGTRLAPDPLPRKETIAKK